MKTILDLVTDIIMVIILIALVYGLWNMVQATKFSNLTTGERAIMFVTDHEKYVNMEKSYKFVENIKDLVTIN